MAQSGEPMLKGRNHRHSEHAQGEEPGRRLSTAGFLALSVLGMAVIAAFQHRLSGLGHEASHYALFKNKLANELVSDLLCMFPLMAMTQRFRVTHLGHHQFLNDAK